MHTVFVSGAEGFAGTHLIEHLRQGGVEVVAGVRNRGRKLALERRYGKAIVCDVSDAINVARAIASVKPDGVVHLAGGSRPWDANSEPLEAYQSIVTGWANILDGVRRAVPRARLLMVSACDVYGNAGADGRPIAETTPPAPVNTFGSLKATAESIAQTFHRNYHLDVTIARPFHYTGPGQPQEFFFASVARRITQSNGSPGRSSLQLPDLSCTRDLLHVRDVVAAYAALLENGKPDEIYNVCSGQGRTCGDYVRAMIEAAGGSMTVSELPTDGDEAGIKSLVGDNSKICNELGWKPVHSAEAALSELIRECAGQATSAAQRTPHS